MSETLMPQEPPKELEMPMTYLQKRREYVKTFWLNGMTAEEIREALLQTPQKYTVHTRTVERDIEFIRKNYHINKEHVLELYDDLHAQLVVILRRSWLNYHEAKTHAEKDRSLGRVQEVIRDYLSLYEKAGLTSKQAQVQIANVINVSPWKDMEEKVYADWRRDKSKRETAQ